VHAEDDEERPGEGDSSATDGRGDVQVWPAGLGDEVGQGVGDRSHDQDGCGAGDEQREHWCEDAAHYLGNHALEELLQWSEQGAGEHDRNDRLQVPLAAEG
jgi:hypothetical protein